MTPRIRSVAHTAKPGSPGAAKAASHGYVSTKGPDTSLAVKIAAVKLLLAGMTVALVAIDGRITVDDQKAAAFNSLIMSGVFFGYMLLGYLAVRLNWVSFNAYRFAAPFLDVLFCGILILGTEGYLSPFSLWLVMAVVSASFCADTRIVLGATALAMVLQVLIAFVPQTAPLDLPSFAGRTTFILALGLVMSYVGNLLSRKSMMLSSIDVFSRAMSECSRQGEAVELLLDHLTTLLRPRGVEVRIEDGPRASSGGPVGKTKADFPLPGGQGVVTLDTGRSLSPDDAHLTAALVDRLALTLRRITATEKLVIGASKETRLQIADELHDTHIQNLTAIDLQVEVMLSKASDDLDLSNDLDQIRRLTRTSSVKLREFLEKGDIEQSSDPEVIIGRAREKWTGNLEFESDEVERLHRSAWTAIEVILREGLANAKQHAGADWGRLTISQRADGFIVALETNGDTPELPISRIGYGLARTEAAIRAAGGQMSLRPRPGGGVILEAAF